MSKTNFTPGPWSISGYCRDYCGYYGCTKVWVSSGDFTQGTGFTEADAHLIVASPKLYEALKKLVEATTFGEFAAAKRNALEVLAEARGEAC